MIMELSNQRRFDLIISMFCSLVLFAATYKLVMKSVVVDGDFAYHSGIAAAFRFNNLKQVIESGNTYFMWHAMVSLLYRYGHMSIEKAGTLIMASANVLTLNVCMNYIKRKIPKIDYASWIYMGIGLFFLGPLFFPWINPHYYLGVWSPNPWQNPTENMVRPFAVISIILILDILESENVNRKKHVILSVVLMLRVLADPSFLQVIAPAMVVYVLVDTIALKKIQFRKYLLLASAFIPAGCMMILQLWIAFYSGSALNEGIGIGAFKMLEYYVDNVWAALIACIAFPLFVFIAAIIVQGKDVLKNSGIILMVSCLVVGWCEMAFLYEKGYRIVDANFAWGYMLAVFIAFVLSIVEFIKITESDFKYKSLIRNIGVGLFSCHLLFGIWDFQLGIWNWGFDILVCCYIMYICFLKNNRSK